MSRGYTPRGCSSVASPAFSGFGKSTIGITLSQSVVMRSEHGLKSHPVTRSRCQQVPHQPSMQPYLISRPRANSTAADNLEFRRTVANSPPGINTTLIGPSRVLRHKVRETESPSDSPTNLAMSSMDESTVSVPLTPMIRSPSRIHMPSSSSVTHTFLFNSQALPSLTTSLMPTPRKPPFLSGKYSSAMPMGFLMVTSKTARSPLIRFTFLNHSTLVAFSATGLSARRRRKATAEAPKARAPSVGMPRLPSEVSWLLRRSPPRSAAPFLATRAPPATKLRAALLSVTRAVRAARSTFIRLNMAPSCYLPGHGILRLAFA
mmetsp:Transcript_57234/g.69934  ORF Transcript_57234/g.69934 Transcript_57234/m.69934 type:complete len:319 (-) Transcript_57234:2-958(-)